MTTKHDTGSGHTTADCAALQTCCKASTFPAAGVADCEATVKANDDAVCVNAQLQYAQAGSCAIDSGGPPLDSECGTIFGPTWCSANGGTAAGVLCDDFDSDSLSSYVNYVGISRVQNLVNTHWVSEFCGLHAALTSPDSGLPPSSSSYTEHPYVGAPTRGEGSIAFDLFVPGASTCSDVVISRFLATESSTASETDAIFVSVALSDVVANGATTTSYTLGVTTAIGATGAASAPATITVSPRSQDGGWVRVVLNVSSYALAMPASAAATVAWYFEKEPAAQATSMQVTSTGQLVSSGGTTGAVAFDVGLIARPTGDGGVQSIPLTCDVFVDNVVSTLPQ